MVKTPVSQTSVNSRADVLVLKKEEIVCPIFDVAYPFDTLAVVKGQEKIANSSPGERVWRVLNIIKT